MITEMRTCKTDVILRSFAMQYQENGDGEFKELLFGPVYEEGFYKEFFMFISCWDYGDERYDPSPHPITSEIV